MKSSRQITDSYFQEHPEAKDEVLKAYYAFHAHHNAVDAHYFRGYSRDSECQWCGRTREHVRYADETPKCLKIPAWFMESIESVIRREEHRFEILLKKAEQIAEDLDILSLTGEYLSILHHTHGIDPSMLECALIKLDRPPIPEKLHDDYQKCYDEHCALGKRGQKRTILKVKETL